jgi:hypothetical protein
MIRCALLLALLFVPSKVLADPAFAVNASVIEVRALPGGTHVGTYPGVGVSAAFSFDRLTVIPQLGVEYDFANKRAGFVPLVTLDYSIIPDRVGLDLGLILIHDQDRLDFSTSQFYAGPGIGFSVFLGRFTVSPFCNLFRGLNTHDWSLVPGLNLAVGL